MAPPRVYRLPYERLGQGGLSLLPDLLGDCFALQLSGFLSPGECEAMARGVYRGRPRWASNFRDEQFTLGRAWYAHYDQDRLRDYFLNVATGDQLVDEFAPGFQAGLQQAASRVTGEPVVRWRGYAGAGIQIFPARGHLSRAGADIHYDWRPALAAEFGDTTPALSLVVMLQRPERGGGLRLWDALYDGSDEPSDEAIETESALVDYDVGDLVVFSCHRLHQIQPFEGDRDRISGTAHVALGKTKWKLWF